MRQSTTRATQWYPNQAYAREAERSRLGRFLPADEAYQMIRKPNQLANPNMCSIITSAPSDRVNEYLVPHREIEPKSVRERREAIERLQRATDPEVMEEQRVNMNRRLNQLTAYVPTSPVHPRSPVSDSSGSVQIVEGPKPEVIDLSIDEIEAMFMEDVTDQNTQADAQAKAAAEAEEEARRSGKPVKRKKTEDTTKPTARKSPPGPDPDKGRKPA